MQSGIFGNTNQKRKCPSEPEKPFEQTKCGLIEKIGIAMCDEYTNVNGSSGKQDCMVVLQGIAKGTLDGAKGREILINKYGEKVWEQARRKAIQIVEEMTSKQEQR